MTRPVDGAASPVTTMAVDAIKVRPGRRPTDEATLARLRESMFRIGMIHPVAVDREGYLVVGLHRLETARWLGWTEIAVTVLPLDASACELAEIDENLMRNELTVLERAEHHVRRKALLEARGAVSTDGGDRRSERARSDHNDCDLKPYSVEAAEKLGVHPNTVRDEVRIGATLAPDVKDAIRGTPLAGNKTELLALARQPAEAQRRVVAQVAAGEVPSVRAAVAPPKQVEIPAPAGPALTNRSFVSPPAKPVAPWMAPPDDFDGEDAAEFSDQYSENSDADVRTPSVPTSIAGVGDGAPAVSTSVVETSQRPCLMPDDAPPEPDPLAGVLPDIQSAPLKGALLIVLEALDDLERRDAATVGWVRDDVAGLGRLVMDRLRCFLPAPREGALSVLRGGRS